MEAKVVKQKYNALLKQMLNERTRIDLEIMYKRGIIDINKNRSIKVLYWKDNSYQGLFNIYRQLFKITTLRIIKDEKTKKDKVILIFPKDGILERMYAVRCIKNIIYGANNYLGYLYNKYKEIIEEINTSQDKQYIEELTEVDENGYVNWINKDYTGVFLCYSEPFKMGFVKIKKDGDYYITPI